MKILGFSIGGGGKAPGNSHAAGGVAIQESAAPGGPAPGLPAAASPGAAPATAPVEASASGADARSNRGLRAPAPPPPVTLLEKFEAGEPLTEEELESPIIKKAIANKFGKLADDDDYGDELVAKFKAGEILTVKEMLHPKVSEAVRERNKKYDDDHRTVDRKGKPPIFSRTTVAPPPIDPFVAKYGNLPYCTADRFLKLEPLFVKSVLEHTGASLFSPEETTKLADIHARYKSLQAEQMEWFGEGVRERFKKLHIQAEAAVLRGDPVAEFPNVEKEKNIADAKRRHFRLNMVSCNVAASKVWRPALERLEKLARDLTAEVDEFEQSQAVRFHVKFHPSIQLQTLAFAASRGFAWPAKKFTPTANFVDSTWLYSLIMEAILPTPQQP